MTNKKILNVTCGSRTIWFNKEHPAAIYCDIRKEELTGIWKSGNGQSKRTCYVDPDIQCDFTNLPFEDETFHLIVFDPPHLKYAGENSWLAKKIRKIKRTLAGNAARWIPRMYASSKERWGTGV